MAIEYRFLDVDDAELIATSELPVEDGIAVAVRTSGYEIGEDEVVELSIVDLAGKALFSQRVKPQNAEGDYDPSAAGGITPEDVADAPELFQFEDEVSGLFEGASVVVGQHVDFISEAIESSWVSLAPFEGFDLIGRFCASHCTADYPGQPAAVATLEGIAGYYGVPCDESGTEGIARAVAACYLKLVEEHASARAAKGSEHWAEYDRKLEEAARGDERRQAAEREKAIKGLRVSALLWLCAAAVFSNLAVQMSIRGIDLGFVLVAAAAAVFFAVRWVMCLYSMYKLRNHAERGNGK